MHKKPESPPDTRALKPRAGGLWLAKFGGGNVTDEEAVRRAKERLVDLMQDPYYYEAMLRTMRDGGIIDDAGGRLPEKVGELAGKHQWPQEDRTPKPRGHPPHDDLRWLRDFSAIIDRQPVKRPVKHYCQKLVQFFYSDAPSDAQSKLTTEIYEKLRALRRRDRGK
jgi:hypothetical protein